MKDEVMHIEKSDYCEQNKKKGGIGNGGTSRRKRLKLI